MHTRVAVALGSNLGDRRANLAFGITRLGDLLTDLRVSSFHETLPVGVSGPQPLFLNAAAVGDSNLSAETLLARLLEIELACGRQRPAPGAPRTLDLDLVLHGETIVSRPGLDVPHPRFRERRFVLGPLAEIAADMVDPVTGKTVRELLAALESG